MPPRRAARVRQRQPDGNPLRLLAEIAVRARGVGGDSERAIRQIARHWGRATDVQREKFRDAWETFSTADREVAPLVAATARARVEADELQNELAVPDRPNTEGQWRRVIAAYERAVERQSRVVRAQGEVNNAVATLRTLAGSITGGNAIVDAYLGNACLNARREEVMYRNELRVLRHRFADTCLPRRVDGVPKVPEHWAPSRIFHERDAGRAQDFKGGPVADGSVRDGPVPPIDPNEWTGSWPVEGGGHGMTALWFRLNDSNDIMDRVLRKDTYKTAELWNRITSWDHPSDNVRNGTERKPIEVACHHGLEAIQNRRMAESVNVPHLRGWTIDNEELRYSLLLDWCSYGDLGHLIETYRELPNRIPIPEPFLWRTFLSLAVAGLAMEKGHVREQANPRVESSWKQIVHRDLKPQNIFLDEPSTRHFTSYPTPRVGDFGVAVQTWEGDVLNPSILVDGNGTLGYQAPEQVAYVDLRDLSPVERFKQLAHTNVFGVGMVMFALATQQRAFDPNFWLGDGSRNELKLSNYQIANTYSTAMKDLIRSCIRFNPISRLTFEELLEEIEQAIERDRTHDRKDGTDDDYGVDDGVWENDNLLCDRNKYAAAMTLQDLNV